MANILIIDDTPQSARLLEAVLAASGYAVCWAPSGPEALELLARQRIDLVLLDIVMPGMDGFEVCRRLRAGEATVALPIIMITSSGNQEKLRALEAGADDFVAKPFDRAELLARVKSLLRVKEYHDKVQEQAAQLAEWNTELEARVATQVSEIQRLARLRRFLSPQLADLVVSTGDLSALESHRREIAVLFCDLHGFTAFAESAEPEDVMTALREFHEVLGALVDEFEATVGYFAGDGIMVFFNDPLPCQRPALKAVEMAVALRTAMAGIIPQWTRRGFDLSFGVGVSLGYATLGEIGFEGRVDYGAIGSVVNLASRLCDETNPGQILVSRQAYSTIDELVDAEPLEPMMLHGFTRPVVAYAVNGLRDVELAEPGSGPDGLTSREVEILRLLAAGASNKEMSLQLTLSVRTVERHIQNAYDKIGAHGRAEATAYAIAKGIARLP